MCVRVCVCVCVCVCARVWAYFFNYYNFCVCFLRATDDDNGFIASVNLEIQRHLQQQRAEQQSCNQLLGKQLSGDTLDRVLQPIENGATPPRHSDAITAILKRFRTPSGPSSSNTREPKR